MTLETGGDVRFQVRPIENVQIPDGAEPEKLILDGQQRLTSLTQVLGLTGPVKTRDQKRHATERYYYIDIKKALATEDLDEAFNSVGKGKTVTSDFGRKVELGPKQGSNAKYKDCLIIFRSGIRSLWLVRHVSAH